MASRDCCACRGQQIIGVTIVLDEYLNIVSVHEPKADHKIPAD